MPVPELWELAIVVLGFFFSIARIISIIYGSHKRFISMNFGQRLPGSTIELYMTESSTNTRQTDIYNALRLHTAETLISFGNWEETASNTTSGKKKY